MKDAPQTTSQRQRKYVDKQKKLGRRQRAFWLTAEEYQTLRRHLEEIRAARNGGDGPDHA